MRQSVFAAALSVLIATPALSDTAARIVTVGGALTEIVFALGQEHRLVARDSTSTHPELVEDLPDVGYARALAAEGVLSVKPDLILATEGAGPPETMDVLRAAGVKMMIIPEIYTAEGVADKITAVGTAIEAEEAAAALREEVAQELALAVALATANPNPPKVLFVLSAASGRIMAAGRDTAADGILQMAGAKNAMTAFPGYKPVTDEAIIQAAPDVVLMMSSRNNHAISDEEVLALPAIALTPAGQAGRIVRLDGALMLQFGPRAAKAVSELAKLFHGAIGTPEKS